jgi:hypothetical protein
MIEEVGKAAQAGRPVRVVPGLPHTHRAGSVRAVALRFSNRGARQADANWLFESWFLRLQACIWRELKNLGGWGGFTGWSSGHNRQGIRRGFVRK